MTGSQINVNIITCAADETKTLTKLVVHN